MICRVLLVKQRHTMSLILIFTLLLLPFAAPFASGSLSTSGTSTNLSVKPNIEQSKECKVTARYASTAPVDGEKKSSSVRNFFRRLKHPDDRWKYGETTASFPSKLIFQYTSPLLNIASKRRLEAEDSFPLPDHSNMEQVVPELTRIYSDQKRRSMRKLEETKQKGQEDAINSESLALAKSLLIHQQKSLLFTGVLRLLNTAIQAFPAVLVARFLRLVEAGNSVPLTKVLTAAVILVLVLSIKMITENQFFHHSVKCSTQVRGALAGLIFDKSLRLPGGGSSVVHQNIKDEEAALGAGGVLNLMQSDASIVESAALQIHTIWDGPLQIAVYTTLLFRYLGSSVVWGIGVLMLTIPINSVALRILNQLSRYENEAKDARTKRTAESISNMKLLKLQGWEQTFADDIRKYRREELRRHVARGIVRAINSAVSNAVPALVLVVTLTAYAKTGKPIVASTIFTAISLFNQLRFPLFFYPMLIDALANGRNAMRRMSSYLSAEEIVNYTQHLPAANGGSITMKNGNFLWPASSTSIANGTKSAAPALADVELSVRPGEVVAIVGSVGIGKTALIKGLLGELIPVPRTVIQHTISDNATLGTDMRGSALDKPTVISEGNIAYCSQEAWLPKGTLRDAILFGREYDEERYKAAIYDSGLDKDIVDDSNAEVLLNEGVLSHDTDVGEGGSSLSGGQRARVALARALYGGDDTKVFLLDDVLSALDARLGSTVFNRLSARLRKRGVATLLVTNDPSIPRRCDKVILMGKAAQASSCSTILDMGSYDELIARGHKFRSFSTDLEISPPGMNSSFDAESPRRMTIEIGNSDSSCDIKFPANNTDECCHADPDCERALEQNLDYVAEKLVYKPPQIRETQKIMLEEASDVPFNESSSITHLREGATRSLGENSRTKKFDSLTSPETLLTSADDRMSSGTVPFSTYAAYFKAVGHPLLVATMLFAYITANGAQFFQQYTVAKWTELSHGNAMATALSSKYLASIVNAAGVVSVFLWLRSFLTTKVGMKASEFFHSRMLSSVFRAPMSFFDATPSGQLLSRFGKEMETVDRGVPDSIGSVLFCFLQIFMSIGALAGVVTPGMLIPLMIVSVLYVKAMSLFRPAARDMRRAETKTRSPIYTHFAEALRGTETIRSIRGARDFWSLQHKQLSNQNLAVFSTVKAFDRWLSTRLETLGNIVVFTAAVASVFLTRSGKLKAGSAGWGLTQSLSITGLLTWAVRCLTDLETNMMSVMRVKELTDLESVEVVTIDGKETTIKSKMPVEPSEPGRAMEAFIQRPPFNATLAPLDTAALVQSGWPWQGNIHFSNVSMRYSPTSQLVLKQISLYVPAGSTLGIVGRSGSGKSSLLLTLFRLVEIDPGGFIEIDGVDIRSVSLESLRQSLAIIPQDPVLFAGSIAYNLDATGSASAEEMWTALDAASPSLARQFRMMRGLDTYISEGGKNLSQGQRQLICLARALLRKSKILVLDEATSSVDSKTDTEVQDLIRREFVEKGVTVVTVAHRLGTVLGYDKIAVLGDGELLEYGPPNQLLRIPGGELRQLVDADRRSKGKGLKKEEQSYVSV